MASATAPDELLKKMFVARKAALKPLAQFFLQALQQRGLNRDEATDWAGRMLQVWVRAGMTIEAAQRRYILVCGGAAANKERGQEAAEESLWFALQGSGPDGDAGREAVRMAAKVCNAIKTSIQWNAIV